MKRILFLVLTLVIAVISVVILTDRRTENFEKANTITHRPPNTARRPNDREDSQKKNINANDHGEIRGQQQLLAIFHKSANDNDSEGFRLALSALLSRKYEADPKALLEQLTPYLNHENRGIRYELAKTFLWVGLKNQKAIQTLLDFVDDQNDEPKTKAIPELPGESYTEDFRKNAAKLLTTYRIEESIEPLWNAYQQTSDRSYLRNLSVFKDKRVSEEALSLVELRKAKYSDLHEIFGTYKVKKTAIPLEAIFKARQERYPSKNQLKLAWSLYQITEKQKYYDYLAERKFYLTNTQFEMPNVLVILENILRADDGSDLNARGDKAFLSLLARKDGREIVENYLVEVFDEKIKSPLDAKLRYQVAAHLESDKVNDAAQRYEEKYSNGLWPHYSRRKGWPINNLLDGFDY